MDHKLKKKKKLCSEIPDRGEIKSSKLSGKKSLKYIKKKKKTD